jgi:hypothetical protein
MSGASAQRSNCMTSSMYAGSSNSVRLNQQGSLSCPSSKQSRIFPGRAGSYNNDLIVVAHFQHFFLSIEADNWPRLSD